MVQLDWKDSENPNMYDLSFIYSLKCNIDCSFCMYDCGPDRTDFIEIVLLREWLATVDMNKIASFGVYGGEPSILLDGYSECMDLVSHLDKPHFVITNGSWSKDIEQCGKSLKFCGKYKMQIIVSGTPEHRRHQDRQILEALNKEFPDAFRLKPLEENYHAMGRMEGKMPFSCTGKCMWWDKAIRIGVFPDGSVLFQSCDGKYPLPVGDITEPFSVIDQRIREMRQNGFEPVCDKYTALRPL